MMLFLFDFVPSKRIFVLWGYPFCTVFVFIYAHAILVKKKLILMNGFTKVADVMSLNDKGTFFL